jgi:hypothetical protein
MVHRSLLVLAVMSFAGFATMGCEGKPRVERPARSAPASNELAGAAITAPMGEQRLDTSTPVAPTPANRIAATNAPLSKSSHAVKARKAGSDENLPKWVPLRGRLTVVEAPDLAENLGLVPKGTTKATDGRISVADLMANGGGTTSTTGATSATSATWLASNGRVRHSRGR